MPNKMPMDVLAEHAEVLEPLVAGATALRGTAVVTYADGGLLVVEPVLDADATYIDHYLVAGREVRSEHELVRAVAAVG